MYFHEQHDLETLLCHRRFFRGLVFSWKKYVCNRIFQKKNLLQTYFAGKVYFNGKKFYRSYGFHHPSLLTTIFVPKKHLARNVLDRKSVLLETYFKIFSKRTLSG